MRLVGFGKGEVWKVIKGVGSISSVGNCYAKDRCFGVGFFVRSSSVHIMCAQRLRLPGVSDTYVPGGERGQKSGRLIEDFPKVPPPPTSSRTTTVMAKSCVNVQNKTEKLNL